MKRLIGQVIYKLNWGKGQDVTMSLQRKRGTTDDQCVIVEVAAQPWEVGKISNLRNRWPAKRV